MTVINRHQNIEYFSPQVRGRQPEPRGCRTRFFRWQERSRALRCFGVEVFYHLLSLVCAGSLTYESLHLYLSLCFHLYESLYIYLYQDLYLHSYESLYLHLYESLYFHLYDENLYLHSCASL